VTPEIPTYLTISAVAMGLAFLFSVWLLVVFATRRWEISFVTLAVLLGWFGGLVVLGKSNFFAGTPFFAPNLILTFLVIFLVLRKLYYSPAMRAIADKIPPTWIISVHIWRIGGIGFITLYGLGILPAEFAFPSGYGDMFVGVTAPLVALIYFLKTPYAKKLAIAWNYIGIADLIMAVSIAILAYPDPFPTPLLATEIPTAAFAFFPLILVPAFAVPLSILLHFFSLRTLKKRSYY